MSCTIRASVFYRLQLLALTQDTHYSFKQSFKHGDTACANMASQNIFLALAVLLTLSPLNFLPAIMQKICRPNFWTVQQLWKYWHLMRHMRCIGVQMSSAFGTQHEYMCSLCNTARASVSSNFSFLSTDLVIWGKTQMCRWWPHSTSKFLFKILNKGPEECADGLLASRCVNFLL